MEKPPCWRLYWSLLLPFWVSLFLHVGHAGRWRSRGHGMYFQKEKGLSLMFNTGMSVQPEGTSLASFSTCFWFSLALLFYLNSHLLLDACLHIIWGALCPETPLSDSTHPVLWPSDSSSLTSTRACLCVQSCSQGRASCRSVFVCVYMWLPVYKKTVVKCLSSGFARGSSLNYANVMLRVAFMELKSN